MPSDLLPHGSNIETKIQGDYKGEGDLFRLFKDRHYVPWHAKNIALKATSDAGIKRRVGLLEKYMRRVDYINGSGKPDGMKDGWITAQSKFRPTVLEQFIFYTLKDCPHVGRLGLTFRNKAVFGGMGIRANGNVEPKTKDVDCALVKEETVALSSGKHSIAVPAIAVEVKTYLDKTMWSEAQFTAMLMKRGNPECKVYLVAETNQVDTAEMISDSPVDEVFILRAEVGRPLDWKTAADFYMTVEESLRLMTVPRLRQPPGRLLHPQRV